MRWSMVILVGALVVCLLGLGISPARAVAITFTGDVEADFPVWAIYPDRGGLGDVGLPFTAPPGTAVGWDLFTVGAVYDSATDTLYVGFNMANGAISGDADGDGDPAQTAAWLADLNGEDLANLEATESLDILIDVDQSCELDASSPTDYEVVAGIPNTGGIETFTVTSFSQDPLDFTTPGAGYVGQDFSGSVFASPSATQPDLEFMIGNFCADIISLAGPTCVPGTTPISFSFRARSGSAADDGVGEDSIDCMDISYTPTAVSVKDMQGSAASRPGLLLALTGLPLLLLTGGAWVLRRKR